MKRNMCMTSIAVLAALTMVAYVFLSEDRSPTVKTVPEIKPSNHRIVV